MAGLPILSGKEVAKILSKLGYKHIRTRGSHMIFVKETGEGKKTIPVPNHKELARGTLRAIIKQTGLSMDDFSRVL